MRFRDFFNSLYVRTARYVAIPYVVLAALFGMMYAVDRLNSR